MLEYRIFGNMTRENGRLDLPHSSKAQDGRNGVGCMLFTVVVDFQLKPGARAQFRRLIDVNADASVRDEPGCLQFDVLEPDGEGDRVLLYEIYTDKAAFEAHLRAPHYRTFADASADLCLEKKIIRCDLVFSGANVASQRSVP